MEQISLSDIITAAWEEIKGHVLKVLKELKSVKALRFYGAFRQRWKQSEPAMVSILERYFPVTIAYYACPQQ